MPRTVLHALAATALASAVAVPVAAVALADPTRPAPDAAAPALVPLPATSHAQELSALRTERGVRRAEAERVRQAELREAARRAAAKAKAERVAVAKAAAEKAAAREAAAEKAAAREAAAEKAAAREAAAEKAAAREAAAEAAKAERVAAAKAVAQRQARQAERASAPARASRGGGRTALPATSGSARTVARSMLAAQGQADQFGCLDALWSKESGWSVTAANPSSGAYGIPQSLPGSKMASAGSDWRTSARTQIAWGLDYIDGRYGSPCSAWRHSQANNWY